jgi:hypothetical protein
MFCNSGGSAKAGPGQRPGKLLLKLKLPSWEATGGSKQEGKRAGDCRPTYAIALTAGLAGAIAALWFKRSEASTAAAAKPGPRVLCAARWR